MEDRVFDLIAIGASSGGMHALTAILSNLNNNFSIPIVIIQHIGEFSDDYFSKHLRLETNKYVKEAEDKELIKDKNVYIAPPGYHLLAEYEGFFSLNEDPRVNYARPSIDVFFESAADVYEKNLIGVLLTGANSDGARGLKKVQGYEGYAIVQSPESCTNSEMPISALDLIKPDQILDLLEISKFLNRVDEYKRELRHGNRSAR